MAAGRRRRKARLPEEPVEADIVALSDEARGIAHVDGRTVFVDQALPGERVRFRYTRLTKNIAEGTTVTVLKASDQRVAAKCDVFGTCGGCSLQHMSSENQLAVKQSMLFDQLRHNGVEAESMLPPLTGPEYGYRHKARLGVRYVAKKEKTLVGFRERNSSFITDTKRCEVLHPSVGHIIEEIAACIDGLQARKSIAQIEVAVGDNHTVLVFRNLEALSTHDRDALKQFCDQQGIVCYLQPGKPDDLELLTPDSTEPLFYRLPLTSTGDSIKIEFAPADFTQVNPDINRAMVNNAIDYLELDSNDHVLDLFSGLGNFSLAMAKSCRLVTAVEGSLAMVQKARLNAQHNDIHNCEFHYADLYSDEIAQQPWLKQCYDRILLDPPRSGALAMMPHLKKMQASIVVYVSCHPATLARDAAILVNDLGYRLVKAGIMDMFPHTAHVESIAVFKK